MLISIIIVAPEGRDSIEYMLERIREEKENFFLSLCERAKVKRKVKITNFNMIGTKISFEVGQTLDVEYLIRGLVNLTNMHTRIKFKASFIGDISYGCFIVYKGKYIFKTHKINMADIENY